MILEVNGLDIGNVISDSLRYPTSNWSKVVILGILFLLSIFIIPLFLALGYMFKVITSSFIDLNELPDFQEFTEMFINGLKIFIVYLIYTLPTIIIGILSFMSLWSSINSLTFITHMNGTVLTPNMILNVLGGTALIGLIIAGLYTLIIYPILAVAIGNMAYFNGELGAAFRFDEILTIISKIGWVDLIIWYIVIIIVGITIWIIGSLLALIPILGWFILIFFVYPYLYLFYARAIAWLYSSAFEVDYIP
jgi:hypothetical protein